MIDSDLLVCMKDFSISTKSDGYANNENAAGNGSPIVSSETVPPKNTSHRSLRSLEKIPDVLKKKIVKDAVQAPGSPGRMTLRRKRSSCTGMVINPAYAGPPPMGPDGRPLKSCLCRCTLPDGSVHLAICSSSCTDSEEGSHGSFSSSKKKLNVTFSHVQIREYSRTVGDNPSVTCGPPLSIGWKYNKRGELDIDSYEADKACRCDPDSRECRRLTPRERERLLKEIAGETDRRILTAQIQAQMDQKQRWDTLDQIGGMKNAKTVSPRERILMMKESLNDACRRKSTAKEQRLLWEKAQESSKGKPPLSTP